MLADILHKVAAMEDEEKVRDAETLKQQVRLCECGCGQPTAIAKRTARREGILKGQSRRFIRWHHQRVINNWKGGQFVHKGYVYVYAPKHPRPTQGKYVKRARLVVEKHLGRLLESKEHVHHKNGVRNDDRIENLEVVTLAEHNRYHYQERKVQMQAGRWPSHAC